MNNKIYLRYIGKDKAILPGVPARDLAYGEVKDLKLDTTKLIMSGLYEYAYKEEIPEDLKNLLNVQADSPEETKQKATRKRRVKNGE